MTDTTYTPVTDGIEAIGSHVQQLIDRAQGTTYVAETYKSNATASTLTIQNVGTGPMLTVKNSAGSIFFEVDQSGVTLGQVGLTYTPETYGAVDDCNYYTAGGSITSGSNLLAAVTGVFTALDVGKTIGVAGAGSGGGVLSTTIASYTSATIVGLSTSASTSVSGASILWGTDNTNALNNVWQAAKASGGTIQLQGAYMAGNLNWTSGIGIIVKGGGRESTSSDSVSAMRGSFIMARPGTTGNWIDWSGSTRCAIQSVQLGYSQQGSFATPANGILAAAYSGVESTNLWLDDVYMSGSFSKNGVLFNAVSISGAVRSQFYNYYSTSSASTFATSMAVSATNWSSSSSAFGSVNTIGSWNETKSFHFLDCEFHEQTNATHGVSLVAGAGASTTFPLMLDCVQQVQLTNCSLDAGTFAIKIKDFDTTASRLTRLVGVTNCRFNPSPTMPAALVVDTVSAAQPQITFERCYFNTSQAWVGVCTLGTSATGFDRLTIKDCYSIGAATAAILMVATTSATRLAASWIDCAGLNATVNGSIDARTFFLSPNTITVGGAGGVANSSYNLSTSGFGSLRVNGGFNDPSGNAWFTQTSVSNSNQRLDIGNGSSGSTGVALTLTGTGNGNLNIAPLGSGSLVVNLTSGGTFLVNNGSMTVGGNIAATAGYVLPGVAGSAGGAAVAGAVYTNNTARGWVKFPIATTGASVSATASFNLSGTTVARGGAGDYTITWAGNVPANHVASIELMSDTYSDVIPRVTSSGTGANATRIIWQDISAAAAADPGGTAWVLVTVYG